MQRFRSGRFWRAGFLLSGILHASASANELPVPTAPDSPASSLPAHEGNYRVGVRSFSWVDGTRSKTGLPQDDGKREITATAWYPATAAEGKKPALYFPSLGRMLAAADSLPADQKRFVLLHTPLLDVATNSIPGATPALTDGGWPVVLFSPGGNVSSHAQTALAERIAGNGFVFVAMSHPYSSIDVAPESGLSMSLEWDLDNEDRRIADANDNRLAAILAADSVFVLDQLRRMAADGHSLGVVMNLDRVGIAGHSRGGKTVGRACSSNSAFQACVVIDNIGPARERKTGIEQPFLTLRAPWDEERVAELHDYLGRTGSVSFDVELLDSNHFSCSDLPFFIADLRVKDKAPVDGINSCAGIITAFFDGYLRKDMSANIEWLPAVYSEQVSFQSFETNGAIR